MKHLILFFLRVYKLCISPYLGACCRFHPSCADYAQEAILRRGVAEGSWLTLKRLLKCGPWHGGGVDPVPSSEESLS